MRALPLLPNVGQNQERGSAGLGQIWTLEADVGVHFFWDFTCRFIILSHDQHIIPSLLQFVWRGKQIIYMYYTAEQVQTFSTFNGSIVLVILCIFIRLREIS